VLDPYVYADMGRSTRHVYKFGALLLTWLIGFLVYRQLAPIWLRHLWNIIYATGLALLLLLATYDAAIHPLSPTFRQAISTFHDALISPIPYVVIGILTWASFRK
jgi:hypothetical protein